MRVHLPSVATKSVGTLAGCGVIRAMADERKCWVDVGGGSIFEARTKDLTDEGATLQLSSSVVLPKAFAIYFDQARLVGRTCVIRTHNDGSYILLFTGRITQRQL